MNNLPESALELFSMNAKDKHPTSTPDKGPRKVTLDAPSFVPFFTISSI